MEATEAEVTKRLENIQEEASRRKESARRTSDVLQAAAKIRNAGSITRKSSDGMVSGVKGQKWSVMPQKSFPEGTSVV